LKRWVIKKLLFDKKHYGSDVFVFTKKRMVFILIYVDLRVILATQVHVKIKPSEDRQPTVEEMRRNNRIDEEDRRRANAEAQWNM